MKNPTSLRVPPVDSAENLNIRDVNGNKEDAAVIVVGTTESQMAYIKGILTDLDNGTDGLGALKALIDLIQTDTTAIIADITSAVDEPPTAKSLQDTLHKDGSYTFDNETDSLEAISDSVSTGSLEIEADIGSTATNIIDAATLTQATANWFRNAMVVSIDGDNKGQARRIVASNTGTDSIDVYPAFLAAPTDGDKFLIVSSWQPNVLDQQPDVAVNRTVGTDSVDVFNLNIAGLTYMVNNLTLKFADPAAETITVTLTELINDAPVAVDTFTVTTENFTNYFSLYDMFSRQQLAGDDIQVSMVASADNAYSVTGQYQYSETYTG